MRRNPSDYTARSTFQVQRLSLQSFNEVRAFCEPMPKFCDVVGSREPVVDASLGLFCSERCPGDLIVSACDVAIALREAHVPVISGFHSPVERECLRILLRGRQPIMISPARSLHGMRVPPGWRDPIREGRLLVISPFAAKYSRITAALAAQRNEFIAALARAILIIYADLGGTVEALARRILRQGKPLFTFDHLSNQNLVAAGARAVNASDIVAAWKAM